MNGKWGKMRKGTRNCFNAKKKKRRKELTYVYHNSKYITFYSAKYVGIETNRTYSFLYTYCA